MVHFSDELNKFEELRHTRVAYRGPMRLLLLGCRLLRMDYFIEGLRLFQIGLKHLLSCQCQGQ